MSAEIIKLPVPFRRHTEVTGRQIWDVREPSEKMVWEVCPYLRANHEPCEQCARWFEDPDHGTCQRGCFTKAAEACRVVMAVQEIEGK